MRCHPFLATVAMLAGCATGTVAGPADPTTQLVDPQMRERRVGEDVITEYRETGGPARIVKIAPPLSAPFYLFDDDGDNRIDRHLGQVLGRYEVLLVYAVPFDEYGLIGAPLPAIEADCGISIRVPCASPEERLGTRPPRP